MCRMGHVSACLADVYVDSHALHHGHKATQPHACDLDSHGPCLKSVLGVYSPLGLCQCSICTCTVCATYQIISIFVM